jgi:hypothetical protein
MSDDKIKPNVKEKSTDNSTSKKPSIEKTAKTKPAKIVDETKAAFDAAIKSESAAKAAEDAEAVAKKSYCKSNSRQK